MTDLLDNLEKAEERIVAFYRQVDAGDAAIATYQSTTSATVAPQTVAPYPRYVDDYLNKACAGPKTAGPKTRAPASPGLPGRRSERTPGFLELAEDQAPPGPATGAGDRPDAGAPAAFGGARAGRCRNSVRADRAGVFAFPAHPPGPALFTGRGQRLPREDRRESSGLRAFASGFAGSSSRTRSPVS